MCKDIPSNAADVASLLNAVASSYRRWRNSLADIHDIRFKMRQYVAEARNCMQAAVQSKVTMQDCVRAKKDFDNKRHFGADVKTLLDKVLDEILPESKLKHLPWKDDIDVMFLESDSMFHHVNGTIHVDIVSKKLKRAVIVYVPVKDAVDVNFLTPNMWNGKYIVKALTPETSVPHDEGKSRREWCVIASYMFPSSVVEALDAYFSGKLDNELENLESWYGKEPPLMYALDYDEALDLEPHANELSDDYTDRVLFNTIDAANFRRFDGKDYYGPRISCILNDNKLLAPFRNSTIQNV